MNIFTAKIRFNNPEKFRIFLILAFLVILAFSIRYYFFSISDNIWGADPDERIRVTVNWMKGKGSNSIFPSDLWLPLHFYLIALSIKLFNSILFAPRILHLIIGVLTILPFYKLIRLTFDEKIAFISTFILAFFPIHVLCSIVTLSEGVFLFFFIYSVYYFFKYIKSGEVSALILAIVFIILSSMVRYEAWLFIIFMPLILAIEKKFKSAVLFLGAALIFPIFWLNIMPRASSTMLMFGVANTRYLFDIKDGFYWIKIMSKYLTPISLILAGLGVFYSFSERIKLYLFFIFLILFLFFTYGAVKIRWFKNLEFSLSFSAFLIPFIVSGLYVMLKYFRKFETLIISLFLLIFVTNSINKSIEISPKYPSYLVSIANYLKYHMDEKTKVLLANYEFRFDLNHIPIIIGKFVENFKISGWGGDNLITKESILEYIINVRPKYIVYNKTDNEILNELDKKIGLSFKYIFDSGSYRLYELDYI